ncbi:farnesyl diphosphate synthase [Lacticaseibacillus hulanensis]|uniref:polyprenyl synthetase family protein n=1 Tax=Lacticaseibacillus hulanensis TaxID=2493111 RepID=UPI000FDAC8D5
MDAELRASHDARLANAMAYSLDAGGKRLRPLLVLATAAAFGAPVVAAYPAAAAIEFVHTYSLIHDDLPAMDNADLRRGRATSHVQFDEATAILAGDALLTDAFRLASSGSLPAATRLALVNELATAAGSPGMVAGQMMDMEGSHRDLDAAALSALHRHKTGALLRAAVAMGAAVAGVDQADRVQLDAFAAAFGLGFQIKDDIEDVTETAAQLGKSNSQDAANAKTTYVTLYGLTGARQQLRAQYEQARSALTKLDADTSVLAAIADYLA